MLVLTCELQPDTLEAAFSMASERRVPVLLNPAPYHPIAKKLMARACLLTPNRGEACALLNLPMGRRKLISPDSRSKGAGGRHHRGRRRLYRRGGGTPVSGGRSGGRGRVRGAVCLHEHPAPLCTEQLSLRRGFGITKSG